MHKLTVILSAALFLVITSLSGCGNQSQPDTSETNASETVEQQQGHHHAVVYQCPMKCEGDKTYDKAGKCPACGMDLEEMDHGHDHDHSHGDHQH